MNPSRRPTRFEATLVKKEYHTEDLLTIGFSVPETFHFEAGQFFKILFDPMDSESFRAYSILNPSTKKDTIESYIKLVNGGYGSEKIKKAAIGNTFMLEGPYGVFTFDTKTKNEEHVFICTGTGITPVYSILFTHVETYPDTRFTLIFGTRTAKENVFHKEFLNLEKRCANFRYIPTVSQEQGDREGRVTEHLWKEPEAYGGKTFYICGLKEMVKDVREMLIAHGVSFDNIHIERYD